MKPVEGAEKQSSIQDEPIRPCWICKSPVGRGRMPGWSHCRGDDACHRTWYRGIHLHCHQCHETYDSDQQHHCDAALVDHYAKELAA